MSAISSDGVTLLDLIKGDASDNTVVNVKTGKVGVFAVNGTQIGTYDNNSIDFPAFNLTDGSDKNYQLNSNSAGTAYTMTASSAQIAFGTTTPSITLNKAGTYLLLARVNYQLVGATFASNRNVTTKLRRTNNTPADITNSSTVIGTNVTTTATGSLAALPLPPVVYTTTNTTDVITLFGDVSVIPSAGSLQATEANIVAIRLF